MDSRVEDVIPSLFNHLEKTTLNATLSVNLTFRQQLFPLEETSIRYAPDAHLVTCSTRPSHSVPGILDRTVPIIGLSRRPMHLLALRIAPSEPLQGESV